MRYFPKHIPIPLAIIVAIGCLIFSKLPQSQPASTPVGQSAVSVHYIDVGQGDSELIQLPDHKTMLIDAGKNASAETVVNYIKALGIEKLDYVIGTHPHEDHIGGLDAVIDRFEIGDLYLPKVTTTTKTYQDVLSAVKRKNLQIHTAKGGNIIFESDGIKAELMAPNNDTYQNLNNYSAVVKLTYQNNSFLFTGDAETLSEKEMLTQNYNLKSDVLKLGHHGSATSTSDSFLKAVSPSIAVISCAKENDYGHPHEETIKKLQKNQITTYRTYETGTIILDCDGKTISPRTQ